MPNLVQNALARVFRLPTNDTVAKLNDRIASLEVRARMNPVASGVDVTWGQFDYEYLDALSFMQRWLQYDKMEADPRIKEGLESHALPLITGKWSVLASSDKPIDREIAEFVEANLLRIAGDKYGKDFFTQTSWAGQRLNEILDMRKCGFAMFAKSTRVVEGKVVYDRLQWLEPASVDPHGWKLNETDEIEQVERTYRTPALSYKIREPIPAANIALYVWDLKGARYEGRSKIRSLYGAFMRKDFLVRTAAIWAQKAGAPPPVGHYPQGASQTSIDAFKNFVKACRGTASAETYGVFPLGPNGEEYKVAYPAVAAGEVDRVGALVERENSEIAHGMGTKSNQLGETQSGSRALGETQSADEDVSVQATADLICEIENSGVANLPGLVQELVDWNFPNVREYPRLTVSRVGPRENLSTLDPLIKAIQAKVVPKTVSVMKQVTEKFGITLKDKEYEDALAAEEQARQDAMATKVPVVKGVGPDGKSIPLPAKPSPVGKKKPVIAASVGKLEIEEALARVPDVELSAIRVIGGASHLGTTVYVPHLNEVLLLEGWLEAEPEERVAVLVHQLEALAGPPDEARDKDGKWTGGGGGTTQDDVERAKRRKQRADDAQRIRDSGFRPERSEQSIYPRDLRPGDRIFDTEYGYILVERVIPFNPKYPQSQQVETSRGRRDFHPERVISVVRP